MKKVKYPHQSVLLTSLKGERWKDLPGLEGYFMISNFGRIRRLAYEAVYKNGAVYQKEEQIIRPSVFAKRNSVLKDENKYLLSKVTLDGIRYHLNICRLVYYCFIKKFDLNDRAIVILCKDTDSLNIHPANLVMATPLERSKRTVARGRYVSGYGFLSEEKKDKRLKTLLETNCQEVSQYRLTGKKIRTYVSAAEAERATGIHQSSIREVISGVNNTAGGFIWRLGKEESVDPNKNKEDKKRKRRLLTGQKVSQYTLQGVLIAHYPSIQDAEAASGAGATAIRMVLKGSYKSAKGFFWKKGYGKPVIDLKDYLWGIAARARSQEREVQQLTLEGKMITKFKSIKDAAAKMQVKPASIVDACKGRSHTCAGYKWKYS